MYLTGSERKPHLIEVIMIEDTKHTHRIIRSDDLVSTIKFKKADGSEIDISVEPRDLYEVNRGLGGLINQIRYGEKDHYLVIVNKDGSPIIETNPAISGKVLKVARDWKGLGKAINDSFGGRFQIPRVGLVVVVGLAVAVLIFGVWRGWIPTPRSWGIGQ